MAGTNNTVLGTAALAANTTGNENTAIGVEAATANATGSDNVAVGFRALWVYGGSEGAAFGSYSLRQSTGIRNTGIGASAGGSVTTGTANTFLGYSSGANVSQLATASNSMALGARTYTTSDNQIVFGDENVNELIMFGVSMAKRSATRNYFFAAAGNKTLTGGANIGIGENTMIGITTGTNNVAIGDFAMPSAGTGNIAIGSQAMASSSTAVDVTAIGYEAGKLGISGVGTTAVGRRACANETVFQNNTGIGDSALWLNTGAGSTAMGYRAAEYFKTGDENVFIGRAAAVNRLSGGQNVIIGASANSFPAVTPDPITGVGAVAAGDRNTSAGYQAILVFTGNDVTAVGHKSFSSLTTGDKNTGLGVSSGNAITTGDTNTFVGYGAGANVSQLISAANSTAIGANTFTTASNQVVIGDTNVVETLLRGAVKLNGPITVRPGSSVAPTVNGDVVFELTTNSLLTIKAKGSDGIVRSAAIPLS